MNSGQLLSHFIDGEFCTPTGTGTIPSINPSEPQTVLAEIPIGAQSEVDQAVSSAATAQKAWNALPGSARADTLFAWADRVAARVEELATAIAMEVGKPIGEARGEIGRTVALLRYFAGEAVRPLGDVIPALAGQSLQYSIRQPLGVIGLITPWNFPFAIPIWKAAPALAIGNAVVIKPSEHSGMCAQLLAETSIGLPKGVFNIVHGEGSTGALLTESGSVRAVSFTGSVKTGASVMEACTKRASKFQCEMGGKNAAVVLEDADLFRAANLVAGGAFRYAGQKCTATSRVIVQDAVYDAFLKELISATESLPIGSVLDGSTAIGPVISQESQVRIEAFCNTQRSKPFYHSNHIGMGFHVSPRIYGDVSSHDEICQTELFGPILAVIRVSDLEEAIEAANSTSFGLSTAIYTQSISRAMEFSRQVEAGMVRINGDTTGVDLHAPFGGMKSSSSGTREQGPVATDFYSEWKTIQYNP